LTQCGESGSYVVLGRVVDLMAIPRKVPQEVSSAQAAPVRLMLLMWLRVCKGSECLHSDVVITLSSSACVLTFGRGGCS
jgi:hypothetical protein